MTRRATFTLSAVVVEVMRPTPTAGDPAARLSVLLAVDAAPDAMTLNLVVILDRTSPAYPTARMLRPGDLVRLSGSAIEVPLPAYVGFALVVVPNPSELAVLVRGTSVPVRATDGSRRRAAR